MSKISMHSFESSAKSVRSTTDLCALIPILAIAYDIIVSPLLAVLIPPPFLGTSVAARLQSMMTPRPENKIFWPTLVAITVILVAQNYSRLARFSWPPHVICLFAYLAFCGLSVLWAFKPEISLSRFVLQFMMIISIVIPTMLADRKSDIMRGVFLCFALAVTINVPFVLTQRPQLFEDGTIIGYPGYFSFKGILGECAAITFLLSLHEILYPGLRRVMGIIAASIAIYLIFPSHSKGALAMAIIAPLLAGLVLIVEKKMRLSPALIILPIPVTYEVLSHIPGVNIVNRISWHLYGNYTLSGRTVIWDFVNYELGRKPFLGWGFASFWQVGADGPSIVEAPGWVKQMPSGHSGYMDVMLELGYVGFPFLIIFLFATLHALGRVANRDRAKAWLLLSVALFIMITNTIESSWMRGQDMLWLLFLIIVGDIGRHWSPFPPESRSRPRPFSRAQASAARRPGVVLRPGVAPKHPASSSTL